MTNLFLEDEERKKLGNVRVGIAGAGGLGSNCAMLLVRAGVRKLVVCDFDRVEESNLNRQFYFRDQIGMQKVAALGENLRRIEPDMELDLRDVRLDAPAMREVFASCDVVVEAFDAAESKLAFFEAMLPTGKKLVAASGMAGWGRSNEIRVRKAGANLAIAGDGTSGVGGGAYPQGARVSIVAAMEANSALAFILGEDL